MPIVMQYVKNNSDMAKLLMSKQTQDLADQGAHFGVLAAKAYANGNRPKLPAEYIESIQAQTGPIVVMGEGGHANPRRTAQVTARYPWIEFGSGRKRRREQGGSSPAYRILGRTAARIGSPPRRGGGPT